LVSIYMVQGDVEGKIRHDSSDDIGVFHRGAPLRRGNRIENPRLSTIS
jgi:hypothetical protein